MIRVCSSWWPGSSETFVCSWYSLVIWNCYGQLSFLVKSTVIKRDHVLFQIRRRGYRLISTLQLGWVRQTWSEGDGKIFCFTFPKVKEIKWALYFAQSKPCLTIRNRGPPAVRFFLPFLRSSMMHPWPCPTSLVWGWIPRRPPGCPDDSAMRVWFSQGIDPVICYSLLLKMAHL